MSTVLAALDATPAAGSVLSTAVAIGHTLDADVRALHVGSGDGAPRAVAAAVGVPLAVVAGNPVPAIIEAGEHGDVLFVIVGLPRLPGQQPARRTALSIAARFSKPVVAVPPEERVRGPLRRVLFPLDGTRGVSIGVRSLIAMCRAADIEVVAVHVFDAKTVPRFLDGPQDAAVWHDEFLAQHCAELGVRLRTAPGPTARALLRVADEDDVDVIALGWHQNLFPSHARVVRHVLTQADRPVALVPLPDPTQRSDQER
jgi:nucleotide-binding universal stress UspA family protein